MSGAVFSIGDFASLDGVSTSGSTGFDATLTAANLLDPDVTLVSRTTGQTATLHVDFGTAVPIGVVGILEPTAKAGATFRIDIGTSQGDDSLYDGSAGAFWGDVWNAHDKSWLDPFDGAPTESELPYLPKQTLADLGTNILGRHLTIHLDAGSGNTLDIGNLWVGHRRTTSWDIAYPLGQLWEGRSKTSRSDSGALFATRRRPQRVTSINVPDIDEEQDYGLFLQLHAVLADTGRIGLIPRPDLPTRRRWLDIVGTLERISPLTAARYGFSEMSFSLREWL